MEAPTEEAIRGVLLREGLDGEEKCVGVTACLELPRPVF
jgi:hypothetical protein